MHKSLQDSQGGADAFHVVFMFFCLHVEAKEVVEQAEMFCPLLRVQKDPSEILASWDRAGVSGNTMCLLGSVCPQTKGPLLLATLPRILFFTTCLRVRSSYKNKEEKTHTAHHEFKGAGTLC